MRDSVCGSKEGKAGESIQRGRECCWRDIVSVACIVTTHTLYSLNIDDAAVVLVAGIASVKSSQHKSIY